MYRESQEQYAEVKKIAESVRDKALAAIASKSDADMFIVNPSALKRDDLAFYPGEIPQGITPQRIGSQWDRMQRVEGGMFISARFLEPYSITPLYFRKDIPEQDSPLVAGPNFLENAEIRVELNDQGDIVSFFDKIREREILPDGAIANQFQAFEGPSDPVGRLGYFPLLRRQNVAERTRVIHSSCRNRPFASIHRGETPYSLQ